ncbi:MAG: HAMP domain-containing protein [Deltaproteobacteria bacterium]|nr:HAMP domain-containing protein [Deltaproteobacteria bacterium]
MDRVWQITRSVSVGADGEVLIVDRHGIVVAAPDSSRLLEPVDCDVIRDAVMSRGSGIKEFKYKTEMKVAAYVPVAEVSNNNPLGWSVVIVKSQDEAYAPVYRTRYGLLLAAMTCFLVVSILSPWLSHQVSSRVNKLVAVARRFEQGDLSKEVEDLGKDEIGELGRAFNQAGQQLAVSQQKIIEYSEHLEELVNERTSELKATQAQLVETAHVAGMAEVATGVLHNIGNAITSVNIRMKLVKEGIDNLDVKNLAKTSDMLESNSGKLDSYLAKDARGQKVLPYMKIALNNMAEQRNQILSDIQFLEGQVAHICEIVTLQQSYATGKEGLREEYRINDVLTDSIRMQSDILERNGIIVETDFTYSKPILLDRNQLIQVFVNLIKNAAQSVAAQAPDHKVIHISTHLSGNSGGKSPMLEVVIRDSGIGFPPDLKDKIFNYGFSTKKDEGQGFGLHTCANYLQSIGGSIGAESNGPGKGAHFIIKIPIESQKTTKQEV